jgi:signal peptidase I
MGPTLAKGDLILVGGVQTGTPFTRGEIVVFRPQKDALRVEIKVERSDETQALLDASGLDAMDYESRWGYYRIRVNKADLTKHKDLLISLMAQARGVTE